MRVSFLLILILVSVGSFGQVVSVTEFDHPPFAYPEPTTKEPKGAETAFLNAVLKEAGYTSRFSFVPFTRMLISIEDVGPLLTKTTEREASIDFSEVPVFDMTPVLIVAKDNKLQKLTAPSDVASLKIGFAAGNTFPAFFGKPELYKLDLTSGDDTTTTELRKLSVGRVDAVIELNPYSTLLDIKKLGLTDKFRILAVPTAGSHFFFTVSKNSKSSAALLSKVNAILKSKKFDFMKFVDDELK